MDEAKHTPGPWTWVKDTWNGGHKGLIGLDDKEVLWPTTANEGDTGMAWFDEQETKDADLALIAAAPELLAAIKAAMRIESLWCPRQVRPDSEHEDVALMMMRDQLTAAIAAEKMGE